MTSKSKKKNRSRRRKQRSSSSESTITLSSSPSPPRGSPKKPLPKQADVEVEKVTIDSFATYYNILIEYLGEEHWLATETVAPLLSLQHDHCKCPFLLVRFGAFINQF